MPRPALDATLTRPLGAALLSALTLGLLISANNQPVLAEGGMDCPSEGECTAPKPNLIFVVEYSAAMNELVDADTTRWEQVVQTLATIVEPGSYIEQTTHVALLRYAHDPDPNQQGTPLPGTDLVDGVALDLAWTDPDTHTYLDCQGAQFLATLDALPPPPAGAGTWTRGALVEVAAQIDATRAEQGEGLQDRPYVAMVLTQGIWTSAQADMLLSPPQADPVPVAAMLHDELGVPVYVSELGDDPLGEAAADALAAAGGTQLALAGTGEFEALAAFVQNLLDEVDMPVCTPSLPRVMVVLDASSSMLNLGGAAGSQGSTTWDRAGELIAGDQGIFEAAVNGQHVSDFALIGVLVSGGATEQEQRVLVPYGDCQRDAMAWALAPSTSCESPGCRDPWAGPPITWTFQADVEAGPCDADPPLAISSHMPLCEGEGPECAGSGSFLHLGLQRAAQNQAAHQLAGLELDAVQPTDPSTRYVNVLITDGYAGDSTDAQVQTELEAMFAAGIPTLVIGVGEQLGAPAFEATLSQLAGWGSGGTLQPSHADDLAAVEAALVELIATVQFDPCCAFTDCHAIVDCLDETDSGGESSSESGSESSSESDSGSESSGSETESTSESSSESSSGSSTSEGGNDELGDASTGDGAPNPGDPGCACSSGETSPTAPLSALLGLLGLLGLHRWPRRIRSRP